MPLSVLIPSTSQCLCCKGPPRLQALCGETGSSDEAFQDSRHSFAPGTLPRINTVNYAHWAKFAVVLLRWLTEEDRDMCAAVETWNSLAEFRNHQAADIPDRWVPW